MRCGGWDGPVNTYLPEAAMMAGRLRMYENCASAACFTLLSFSLALILQRSPPPPYVQRKLNVT